MTANEIPPDDREAHRRLALFLRGETEDRLFRHPTGHPSCPTGFCWCDGSLLKGLGVYWRGALLGAAMRLPFNGLKLWLLRRMGARIGKNVYLSVGALIDPVFPQLLTIEDNVFIGMNARILTHEFRIDEFRAGKVILRRGSFIGGFSLVACGVEVGEEAAVAGGAVVALDVPPRTVATGNPAFIWKRGGAAATTSVPQPRVPLAACPPVLTPLPPEKRTGGQAASGTRPTEPPADDEARDG
jgi:acetyltransferase-like isoleucine patch superfamily enzyme